jgi:mono/diheme cytochrome c family protein
MMSLVKCTQTAALLAILMIVSSCKDNSARMGKGFRLPEGSEENGRLAFQQLNCYHCHTVAGANLPVATAAPEVQFELGGEVRRVKSYGELVTAIIQPQHGVAPAYYGRTKPDSIQSPSPMPSFNDRMSVTQLTDIVTFLHAQYRKAAPPGSVYPYYMP